MTPWFRKLHKWVGLIIALQFVLWLGSGLVMSLLDHDNVQGHTHRVHAGETAAPWPTDALSPSQVLKLAGREVQTLATFHLDGRAVYRLVHQDDVWLLDAVSGAPVKVDAATVLAVARKDYTGEGRPGEPELQASADLEAREHPGAIWRVPFSDTDATTLYVSARDGRILERRNDTWRLFDVVWMLHIMDYTGRQNFNNPLVVTAAVGGVWMALSGIWLLFASFRLGEFLPARWRRRHELSVFSPDGTRLRTVEAHAGDNVYVALARNGLQLPSNCGGGQGCGLCEVRFRGHAPAATAADRTHLGEAKIKQGCRLACNLPVSASMGVEVPGGAAIWAEHSAVVEKTTPITPFLREIVLRTQHPDKLDIPPGAYVQVHVPAYTLTRDALHHPDDHRGDWGVLDLPDAFTSREAVRRSYSLALPVEKADGRITLLARFSPGRQDRKRHPPGKGSSYLYSLQPGDQIRFSGPFGDFKLKAGQAEKVFIGGGAGMAPLRAMIHRLLERGATERIHFWYGARSLRDAPYLDEMAALARRHANFTWHLVLSDEAEQAAGLAKGLVHEATHDALLRTHPDLHACEFYLCGPPAMLSATRQLLSKLGIEEHRIAFDDFKI